MLKWISEKYQNRFLKIMKCLNFNIENIKDGDIIVIPDNYEDYIEDKELLKDLTKPFYKYKCNCTIYLKSEYEEQQRKREIIRQREEERKRKEVQEQKEKEEIIECLRQEYGKKWRDKKWIESNIGEYYSWEPLYEYFWTIIGDNWQKVDWKQNIKLEQSIYNKIKGMKVNGVSGESFLKRKFRNDKGYSAGILEECFTIIKEESNLDYGVYCIRTDEEIIYVGSTCRSFNQRMKEHAIAIETNSKELGVYDIIRELKREGKEVYYEILVDYKELNANKRINREDIESMELGFINYFKPRGNVAGIKVPFKYKGY